MSQSRATPRAQGSAGKRATCSAAAELLKEQTGKTSLFVESDCFSLSGEPLGTTPKAIAKLLEEIVPAVAREADYIILPFEEVETIDTDRRSLSLEVNPVDVPWGSTRSSPVWTSSPGGFPM